VSVSALGQRSTKFGFLLTPANAPPSRFAGTLVQIKEALKPDSVFLGAMFGGDTAV
jgi:hypothetical protein